MKRSTLLILVICTLIVFDANAQTSKDEKKKEKAAKKEAKLQEDSIRIGNLKIMVLSKAFVLEASSLYARTGQSFILNSTINFVGFDGKNSTIQLAFDQLVGWNGVGGVTLDGTISKMEVVDNKNGFGFTVNSIVQQKVGGAVTMSFRVSVDGNARVDMSGSFGERLSFQGKLVSLAETSVYKGTSLY